MAWSASGIFVTFIEDSFENSAAYNLLSDTFKVALFNDTTAPDKTVTTANRTYDAGVWIQANEVDDGTEWDAGGEPLDTPALTTASNVLKWDAVDTVSGGTSATLAAVFGCLVHDSSVTNEGICFNYFGGTQSVTDGTFTVVWNGAGIFTITV